MMIHELRNYSQDKLDTYHREADVFRSTSTPWQLWIVRGLRDLANRLERTPEPRYA